ncbi:MAG: ABC transporter ATP-binding protein [Nannocystaceae bacterium]
MAARAIEIQGLVKDYGAFRALHGVDLAVERGEAFGFIGPNGAGKSTTIRCLLDLLRPTAGVVEVLGVRDLAAHPELRARIGYLPGELTMPGQQTGRELLRYFASLRGGAGLDRIEPLADRFGLALDRPVRGLSKGNKQKIGVIAAFMHAPELLILDEPTSGLDPLLQQELLALARESTAAGATLFISSHILSEVEAVAARVAILRAGRVVEVAEVRALRERAGQHVLLRFAAPLDDEAARALAEAPGLSEVTIEGDELRGLLRGPPDRLLKMAARHEVLRWSAVDRNLEELFLDHYRQPSAAGDEGAG